MCLCWFFRFICFVGEFTTMQDFNHTNNHGVYANSCLAALKMPLSFLLLSVNHSEKLNWSSNSDKFSLHYILPQHATSLLFENRSFRIWLKILVCLLFRMLIGSKICCGKRWRSESAFPEQQKNEKTKIFKELSKVATKAQVNFSSVCVEQPSKVCNDQWWVVL